MSKRTLDTIKKEFEALINSKNKAIDDIKNKIQTCESEIIEINESLEAARLENNVDKYDQGKRALWTANNSLEMLNANLKDIESKPLISREEYDQYEEEIESFAKQEEKNMLEELEKLCDKIDNISEKSLEHYGRVNELYAELQDDIGNNCEDYKYMYKDGKRQGVISNRYLGLEYKPKTSIKWMVDQFRENIERAM